MYRRVIVFVRRRVIVLAGENKHENADSEQTFHALWWLAFYTNGLLIHSNNLNWGFALNNATVMASIISVVNSCLFKISMLI